MAKKKLARFAELKTFNNVFYLAYAGLQEGLGLKGKWRSEYFKNEGPIVLELGCGKGEYTVGLAQRYPHKNFIGVDIKGARIWKGAKIATDSNMQQVAFLQTRVDFVEACFSVGEVDEIWVTFPDPQPGTTRERMRLTNKVFLARYKQILKKDGILHLKTDNAPFYEYTLECVKAMGGEIILSTDNLYRDKDLHPSLQEVASIKTHYEKLFTAKGFDICYASFRL
jgi:tRNA (guanine-N7-)-methyltransferase